MSTETTDSLPPPADDALEALAAPLRAALVRRGFTALTPVQRAVRDPALAGKNLRISSQTGSGKTVALGIVLAPHVIAARAAGKRAPAVLTLTPTRELAAQVCEELGWLYADLGVTVHAVTGGTSQGAERRVLAGGVQVLVGTPGRTLDHLRTGALDLSNLRAVVLDEADQMLDMGFRDELEAILAALPPERETHLVSATFPAEVLSLAKAYQGGSSVAVEGTRLGDANSDIEHIVHIVHDHERFSALVNVLLSRADEKALVFARTRADVASLAAQLAARGFAAAALTGELEQAARTRTLEAFRSGALRVLVATDVAARGLDVADLALVVHYEAPDGVEPYTHRSGRTGRAGQKGSSVTLVAVRSRGRAQRVLREAGVRVRWCPAPTADDVRAAESARVVAAAAAALAPEADRAALDAQAELAKKLLAAHDAQALVSWMLAREGGLGTCEPMPLTPVATKREDRGDERDGRREGPMRRSNNRGNYVGFELNWGARDGADPRRITAMLCRRGDVRSEELGAIDVREGSTYFEVSAAAAPRFVEAVRRPDKRDPHLRVRAVDEGAASARPAATPRSAGPRPRDYDLEPAWAPREREREPARATTPREAPRTTAPREGGAQRHRERPAPAPYPRDASPASYERAPKRAPRPAAREAAPASAPHEEARPRRAPLTRGSIAAKKPAPGKAAAAKPKRPRKE